jgi:hypothetical protein
MKEFLSQPSQFVQSPEGVLDFFKRQLTQDGHPAAEA